jgi:hypothetical protein
MNKIKTMRALQLAVGGALLMLSHLASAQFVWIDAKGVRQFSDMPPPPSVPSNKILKQPGRMGAVAASDDAAQSPAEGTASAGSSTAERELDYRKRMKAKAEADAKANAQAANDAQKSSACATARMMNDRLATGRPLRSANAAIMDDNARAQRQAEVNETLAQCN